MDKIALLFQGQGAQHLGMGKILYQNYSVVKEVFDEADSVLKRKISSICFHGSLSELSVPINMFPAILSLNVALYRLYQKMGHQKPDYMAGHSLGEYAALVCSGMLSFSDALHIICQRAEYSQNIKNGRMSIIDNLPQEKTNALCKAVSTSDCWAVPSCLNCSSQVLVSGHTQAVMQIEEQAIRAGASISPLLFSPPLHCRLMDKVSDMLLEQLITVSFMVPSVSVLSNYTARIYPSDANQARQILALQTSNPVLWQQTVRYLLHQKVHLFIEMGSQPILTRISRLIAEEEGIPADFQMFLRKDRLVPSDQSKSFIAKCLALTCSAPNKNWDYSAYCADVIKPYQSLCQLYKDVHQSKLPPTDKQLIEAKNLTLKILKGKNLSKQEQKEHLKHLNYGES